MENQVEKGIEEILLTEEQIRNKVSQLAHQISVEYEGKDPVFVGVLKGVVMFFADIVRRIEIPCTMDFLRLSSYGSGTTSSGKVIMQQTASADLKGRHVVILEDIFDSGRSLQKSYEYVLSQEPASVKICTLLDKPERRLPEITIQPDYTGFVIPDKFVVGYGLDFDEHYRNLPFIGVLKPEMYMK